MTHAGAALAQAYRRTDVAPLACRVPALAPAFAALEQTAAFCPSPTSWEVTSLAVSPDGALLLVGGRPEALGFYDAATRTLKASLDFGLGAFHAVAFSPDGCTFAVGGAKGLMVCDVP
jgi:WD40 repeat protein